MHRSLPLHELSPEETDRINSVRGFLCFYVLWFHFYSSYLQPFSQYTETLFYQLLTEGHVAVQIFFALSGFLIFHSYSRITHGDGPRPLFQFFFKRIFRIFPAWFVALLIYAIDRNRLGVGDFFWNFFFLFGLQPFNLGQITVLQSWSLYVEEIFYLSFPLFIFFFRRQQTLQLLLAFLTLKVLFDFSVQPPAGTLFYTPFNCFIYFSYGIVAYLALPALRNINLSRPAFLFCFSLLAAISIYTKQRAPFIEAYVLFWFLFIAKAPLEFSRPFNFIFRRMGIYCYSIYLMHMICLFKAPAIYDWINLRIPLGDNLRLVDMLIISILMTGLTALLLYYLVERPFVLLGNRMLRSITKRF